MSRRLTGRPSRLLVTDDSSIAFHYVVIDRLALIYAPAATAEARAEE
jgi:hypothetical protein